MAISHEKLHKLFKDRGITSYSLRKSDIISRGSLSYINRKKYINLKTVESLCTFLGVTPNDIFEFIPDEKPENVD